VKGVNQELKFSGSTLAGIFMGRITTWNDAAIAKDNPGVSLPNTTIMPVQRSDGSGTTFVFTDCLSKISPDFLSLVGRGTAVRWPAGVRAKGNEGVAGMIKQMDGAIGYIELIYAEQNKITFGSVKNAAGEFVKASLDSTTKAAATAKVPDDFRVSITNAPGKGVYPIASFTWLLVPAKNADATKQKVLVDFLTWMVNDGQKMTNQLSYAPLPAEVAAKVKQTIAQLK
jgi:phosphate transport system substrate-binding protein